eukprot:scaffold409_cov23-Prasinocladus_malaysianus.AAC.1
MRLSLYFVDQNSDNGTAAVRLLFRPFQGSNFKIRKEIPSVFPYQYEYSYQSRLPATGPVGYEGPLGP